MAIECAKGRGLVLPGGKWEVGETFKEAATRELREETGLIALQQEFLYCGPNIDDYMCYVFHSVVKNHDMRPSDEGNPVWVTWDDLISKSDFRAFYEVLYDVYRRHK